MAIDYGNYAALQGAKPDLSSVQQGIQTWATRSKEATVAKIQDFESKQWNAMIKPFSDAAISDIGNMNFNSFKDLNFATALTNYRRQAEQLGPKAFNQMLRMGYFDPLQFKQKYQTEKKQGTALLEKKLEAYQLANGFDDDEMRKFLKDNGLQTFALENFSEAGLMRELAKPEDDTTWTGAVRDFLGGIPKGAMKDPLKYGTLGAGALGVGYGIGKRFMPENMGSFADVRKTTPVNPFSMTRAQDKMKTAKDALAKMYKKNGGPGANTAAAKKLKLRVKAYEDWIKQKKGISSAAGITKATTTGGRLLKGAKNLGIWAGVPMAGEKITKALGGDEQTGRVAGQTIRTTMSTLAASTNQLIRTKGKKWFITQLAKKGGAGIAVRLLGKAGIGLISGAATGGAMSLVMAGFAANDIRMLYNAINEMSKEANIKR